MANKIVAKQKKTNSEEIDSELVESFKKGLEDIKEGRFKKLN